MSRHPQRRPRIVLVVPRGEAVRNFLYSETLELLAKHAQVAVLSVVSDSDFVKRFDHLAEVLELREHRPAVLAGYVRTLTENAHDRWQWSRVHQNNWALRDLRARGSRRRARRLIVKGLALLLATEPALRALTRLEQALHYRLRPTRELDRLFGRLRPDLVFNGSHIHGLAGELPLRVAKRMKIPTVGFIFSWDNLTSRSRIFVPYDHFLVWHEGMRRQLLDLYSSLEHDQVTITGTPQFDFHFKPRFELPRQELCRRIGIDPQRPFVLYTTGISNHFFDEHLHVELVIRLLSRLPQETRPQLVVRTYVKGTSPEMLDLAQRDLPDVVFPEVLWEPRWQTPLPEDLEIYTNLLRHCALGINAASTVSLELLMHDKPVINLDFDPADSELPWDLGYDRHIQFDHYRPVAESGAVMVARSAEDMGNFLRRGLERPGELQAQRRRLLREMFGETLDGGCGRRVAETLIALAEERSAECASPS